jgi:hypothetical protein
MVGAYQHSSALRACVIGYAVDESNVARPFAENDLLQPRAPKTAKPIDPQSPVRGARLLVGWERVRGADSNS